MSMCRPTYGRSPIGTVPHESQPSWFGARVSWRRSVTHMATSGFRIGTPDIRESAPDAHRGAVPLDKSGTRRRQRASGMDLGPSPCQENQVSLATLPPAVAVPAPRHNFGATAPFKVGVEEELFLVDQPTLQAMVPIDLALAHGPLAQGAVLGEIAQGVVELVTPVWDHASGATRTLRELRSSVLSSGAGALLGVGVHPTAEFGAVEHRPGPRYGPISWSTRSLLRQSAYCGVHVHVGVPDPEAAIVAYNGMRK